MMNASHSQDESFSPLSADAIQAAISGGIWGKVILLQSVGSTNERALRLRESELAGQGVVILAESQTRGRGRHGRRWVSPPRRNVCLSVALKPHIEPRDAALLTIMGAVAVALALRRKTGLEIRIKWPNDLMVNGRKIGGILTELRTGGAGIGLAVIGIGVNVNSGAVDFPEELRGLVTSVKDETGRQLSRTAVITEILNELERCYFRLVREGKQPLLEEWRRLSSTIGRKVRVVLGKEIVSGTAEAIDEDGMLIVRPQAGASRRISAGDVTELR